MNGTSRTQSRFLELYVLVSAPVMVVLSLAAFRAATQKPHFQEIDVERINIVEPTGKLRMVISNGARSPAQTMHGKTFGPGGDRPGIIFYNDEGSENGGLGFFGRKQNGKVEAVGSLTFDQFDQDQVVALQYEEEGGVRQQGLTIMDRPDIPLDSLMERHAAIRKMPDGPEKTRAMQQFVAMQGGHMYGAPRLFAGRGRDKAAVVALSDADGRARLRLSVDSAGHARLDFVDADGRVTYSLSDTTHARPAH